MSRYRCSVTPSNDQPHRTGEPNLWWRKSTHSAQQDCVEMADAGVDGVAVRNSNHPDAGTLYITRPQLADLLAGVKAGEFDDLA
jgi:hypothetical protein